MCSQGERQATISTSSPDLIEREREFHNARFADKLARNAQDQYYYAVKDVDAEYRRMIAVRSAGKVALDYGCATGETALRVASIAKKVHGIDISDVAIDFARRAAAERNLTNAEFAVMDAHATTFADNTFDVVFGLGIVHHLDTERCLREVARILMPGGIAIFREPLGVNPLFNLDRAATPDARTIDEHPLLPVDYRLSRQIFSRVDWRSCGLATLAVVPFRNTPPASLLFGLTRAIDRIVLALPGLRWMGWQSLIVLTK